MPEEHDGVNSQYRSKIKVNKNKIIKDPIVEIDLKDNLVNTSTFAKSSPVPPKFNSKSPSIESKRIKKRESRENYFRILALMKSQMEVQEDILRFAWQKNQD